LAIFAAIRRASLGEQLGLNVRFTVCVSRETLVETLGKQQFDLAQLSDGCRG